MNLRRLGLYLICVMIYTHYSEQYGLNQTEEPFNDRINLKGDPSEKKEGKALVLERKEGRTNISVEGRVAYGAELKIKCSPSWDYDNNTEIIWKKDGRTIFRGRTIFIKRFQKQSFGKYLCEMRKKGGWIQRRSINLTPSHDSQTSIDMSPEPGRFYNFSLGRTKQLYCRLSKEGRERNSKSKEIIWTFQGKVIGEDLDRSVQSGPLKRYVRLNRKNSSILVLKDMDQDNEGSYKCFQGLSVFTAHLLLEGDISVSVSPDSQTWTDGNNETVEFICKINTSGVLSKFIRWSFKPKDGEKEEKLPSEAKEENTGTLSESYLIIENVRKKHEGIYVCQVLEKKAFGRLIINPKLDPRSKPKVTITCQVSTSDGKILWKKQYKNSSFMNQGQKIEGEYNSSSQSTEESTSGYESWVKYGLMIPIFQLRNEMKELLKERENMKKDIKQNQIKINQLRKEMNESKKERMKMQREMDKKEKEEERQNTVIKLLKEVNEERKKMDVERDRKLNILIKSSPNLFPNKIRKKLNADFIWVFDQISTSVNKETFSDPFVSNNYRLCLGLGVNTDGSIGIGVYIMKGEKDDEVEWPMRRTVTLSVVDQDSLSSVETLTLSYDTYPYNYKEERFQKPKKPKKERNEHPIFGLLSLKYGSLKDRPSVLVRDSLLISFVLSVK